MADEQHSFLKEVYLTEYQKLKDEQIARIGFRDNLIYATLVAIGAILSFAIARPDNYQALLILPLATFVLGWIYLSNDRKISDIGRYIRVVLAKRLGKLNNGQQHLFEWELVYKVEPRRLQHKVLQLIVHEALFVGSGFIAILTFLRTTSWVDNATYWIAGLEMFALLVLAIELGIYADLRLKS
jgi:hypothetical protein